MFQKALSAFISLYFICAHSLHSQLPPFHQINQSNGLSSLRNTYISQDSKGYIWIGGFDGLNRFDGKSVKVYRPSLPNGAYSPNISSKMFEDKVGRLWFSSSGALFCYLPDKDSINSIELPGDWQKANSNSELVLIYAGQDAKLWVVANAWLHIYDPETHEDKPMHPLDAFSCYPLLNRDGVVTGLVNLLAAEGGGAELYRYTPEGIEKSRWFTGHDPSGYPKTLIRFACVEGDSLVWLPSDMGLIRFSVQHPERIEVICPPNTKASPKFRDAAVWKNRYLFAGSADQGLFLLDKLSAKPIIIFCQPTLEPAKTKSQSISNVFVGQDGTLWLSVWDEGIFYANPDQLKFKNLAPKQEGEHPVASVAEDREGHIWTASEKNGVKMIYPGAIIPKFDHLKGEPLPGKVFCDAEGDLWAFSSSAVFLKKRQEGIFRKVAYHLNRLYNIVQLSPLDFLLVCPEGLFALKKGRHPKDCLKEAPLFASSGIFDVFRDRSGNLFVSDEVDGLNIYAFEGNEFRLKKSFANTGYSNGMAEAGSIRWFASNKGLLKIDLSGNTLQVVRGKNRALQVSFQAILQDYSGKLWLSSNSGIYRYDPATEETKRYTESDGLSSLQFLPGSACRLSDGRLAFGSTTGLSVFLPDSIKDNRQAPIVHFTEMIVNDTGIVRMNPDYLDGKVFDFNNRTLSFRFTGIDYSAPEEVQYRYRLKGFEKEVVEGGNAGFARYGQLPSGHYTFQVWAANSDGVWTSEPHELHFTVLPPWYATWWARALEFLAAAGLMYGVYRNRVAQIRRREEERRKEAEFRQKEAESKQLAAELQNSVLRLQMNPHFIFNSMNSISSYILQKDVNTANDYLGRFAKLMRSILDLASRPLIPVADEIDLLEQYMSAEAMRFEKKFTWAIDLDPAIDPDDTLLPTMILQPFVENAIWHGLSRKQGAGFILIGFRKTDHAMVCTVEDNGVGRSGRKQHADPGHESKAVKITEERLEMIRNSGRPAALDLIDLYDATGGAAGTKVEIRLPLDL